MNDDQKQLKTDDSQALIPQEPVETVTNKQQFEANPDIEPEHELPAGTPEDRASTETAEIIDQPTVKNGEEASGVESDEETGSSSKSDPSDLTVSNTPQQDNRGKWYVVHTFSGHENKVATSLRQRIESEGLENKIFDILVPTQDKIEIRGGKKEQVKEKIFPGYILVKMDLDDTAWLAVRTTQGVTAFVGMNNKPTPIPDREVASIIKFMTQGAAPTFKDVFMVDDTVKIIDGPFADFIGKVDSIDKEKGKVRVLVSIFGRETPVELDFLQVTKL